MKNRITNLLLIILISFVFCDIAISEEKTIGQFLDAYDKGDERFQQIFLHRMHAAEDALSWANVELNGLGRDQLYCKPGKLVLTRSQVFSIFRDEVESDSLNLVLTNAGINYFLLRGLIRVFPCE